MGELTGLEISGTHSKVYGVDDIVGSKLLAIQKVCELIKFYFCS